MRATVCPLVFTGAILALAGSCSSGDESREPIAYKTTLLGYDSCDALEADLKELFLAELEAELDRADTWWDIAIPTPEGGDAPSSDDSRSSPRQEGTDYSGTNNQEDGVDEADFVKTDGYHIYVLNGGALHIFGVPEFGQLTPVSTTPLEGTPSQMLIHRDAGRAVVFSWIEPYGLPEDHPLRARLGHEEDGVWMWRSNQVSKITVLDISDRGAPGLVRELYLESSYQTARMVEGSVRMSAYSWMYIPGLHDWWSYLYSADGERRELEQAKAQAAARIQALALDDMVPQIYERHPDGSIQVHSLTNDACRSFARPQSSHGRGFTSILSLDLFGNNLSLDADHVLSNWATVYASQDYLYIAESAYDWWWFWNNAEHPEQLNLHMFDIRTPGETRYLGSGRVEGTLNDQFSLDEHEGNLRVATTTNRWGRWWLEDPPQPKNHLYVLELRQRELETVGHLGDIAPGESIFAARMIGDKGYLVTFEQVDPLFTLDLSDPRQPRIVGELKIPGFSTYLHPLGDDKLLSIGVGGDDNGTNWRTQVALFDVADFARPTRMDVEELVVEGQWGWSEALYEHKAFQYWAPKGLLAVPLSSSGTSDGLRWQYTSTLRLIHVDPVTGLSAYGAIDHSDFYNADPETYWSYVDIRRSIFMGDYIYAISDRGITAHSLDDLDTRSAQAGLPGYEVTRYYRD